MFKFKMPILRITQEGERVSNLLKSMPEYGHYLIDDYDCPYSDSASKRIGWSIHNNCKVADSSLPVFDKIIDTSKKDSVKDKLKAIIGEKKFDYLEIVCPYTNQVISTREVSYYGVFFREKRIELKVIDSMGDEDSIGVNVTVVGDTDIFTLSKSDVSRYLKTAKVSDCYSKSVIKLMKHAWGFSKGVRSDMDDLSITEDSIDSVVVYYHSSTRFESKRTYLSPSGVRSYRYKGKLIEVPSPDIPDFEQKLAEIELTGTLSDKSGLNESESEVTLTLDEIASILADSTLKNDEKLTRIRAILDPQ